MIKKSPFGDDEENPFGVNEEKQFLGWWKRSSGHV